MSKKFEKERKELACLAAYYIGSLAESNINNWSIAMTNKYGKVIPPDSLSVMSDCVKFADEYEFITLIENNEEVIDTGEARNEAFAFAVGYFNNKNNPL